MYELILSVLIATTGTAGYIAYDEVANKKPEPITINLIVIDKRIIEENTKELERLIHVR